MFAQLKRLSIRNRIWAIVFIFIGSIVLLSVADVIMLRATLQQEKEATIRQVVDSGHSILAHYEARQRAGTLSREAAQAAALSTIKNMRYNGSDYFWLSDTGQPPRMIMHPIAPELDGGELLDDKFNRVTSLRSGTDGPFVRTDGTKNLLRAFSELVGQAGHGYVTYPWPKVAADGGSTAESFPKLSYVKEFAPWGWVIGSGIYVDDIDAAVRRQLTRIGLVLLGATAALLLLASLIARSITRPLQATMQAMRDIAAGRAGLEPRLDAEGHSEIAELAGNFNAMLDQLQARDQALLKYQQGLEAEVSSRTASLRAANRQLDAELDDRRAAELALQESEERFRGIASVAQDGLIMMDAAGNIGFWNPAAEKIFGYRRDEAVGRELHALIVPERYYAAFQNGYRQFVQSGQGAAVGRTVQLSARCKDGREIPVELSLSAIWLRGAWSSVGIIRDISERKRQEAELQANLEHLQRLNEQLASAQNQLLQSEKMSSIGQLAAGVAHEINNPIGYVSSNLGTLKEYVEELLGIIRAYGQADPLLAGQPEIHQAIESCKQQADLAFLSEDIHVLLRESQEGIVRVRKIVQDLKDFSRIDSMDWAAASLEQGLDSTLNIVANEIRYKADVVKEYAGIPAVECLGSQMNQVFMNLLLNAAQAMETRGTITIRTGATDSQVWIEIADTGKGISAENRKRIFEPFFTTKPVGQGTGLGLSLAYSIVQKHHGTLEVTSEPGRGSCFRIEIPRTQGQSAGAPAATGELP